MTVNKSQRTANGDFKKGISGNPKGRPKGAKDKISRNIKESYEYIFEQRGGAKGFLEWVNKTARNTELFYQWYSKMLPTNVNADVSGSLNTNSNFESKLMELFEKHGEKKIDEIFKLLGN